MSIQKTAKNVSSGTHVQTPTDKIKLSIPEAVRKTGRASSTIRRWIEDFPGVGIKIAGRLYIYKDGLNQILSGELAYGKGNQGRPKKEKDKKKNS